MATLLLHGFCTVVTSFTLLHSDHDDPATVPGLHFCRSPDQWLIEHCFESWIPLDVNFRVHTVNVYAALLEFYIIQVVTLRSLNKLNLHAFH